MGHFGSFVWVIFCLLLPQVCLAPLSVSRVAFFPRKICLAFLSHSVSFLSQFASRSHFRLCAVLVLPFLFFLFISFRRLMFLSRFFSFCFIAVSVFVSTCRTLSHLGVISLLICVLLVRSDSTRMLPSGFLFCQKDGESRTPQFDGATADFFVGRRPGRMGSLLLHST